jgi:carbonic anhydrase
MLSRIATGIIFASTGLAPLSLPAQSHHAAHWAYAGDGGPSNWGTLDSAFSRCSTGHAQSPIDIHAAHHGALSSLGIYYQDTRVNVVNNGHTIQVNYDPGSSIEIEKVRYDLVQFHFHTPSEHTFNGKAAPAELHLVHRSKDGRLAVIGVMIVRGPENSALTPLWKHLPVAEGPAQQLNARVNAADLLPARHVTYRYNGSLTTPPCSEGVKWLVMTSPITLSEKQLANLTAILHANNRPVQPLNRRTVNSDIVP